MAMGIGRRQLETAIVTCAWFVLNISMSCSTKWLYLYGQICNQRVNGGSGCKPYKFPLTITMVHMIFSWAMCSIYVFGIRSQPLKVSLSLAQQVNKIVPLALCFVFSVAMGNLSLKHIYPSFNQMLGSTAPIVTVCMSVLLRGTRYSLRTWVAMVIISSGLVVCSAREANFNALGAFFVLGATVMRGVKSVIQDRLLGPNERLDSVTLLLYMAPWAGAALLCIVLLVEGTEPFEVLLSGFRGSDTSGVPYVLLLLAVSGLNACFLNLANFLVTSYTSAVTLQVLGNVKNCFAIITSVALFRNTLKPEQAVGMTACLTGVWLYTSESRAAKAAASKDKTT